jgi:hypothetical protein
MNLGIFDLEPIQAEPPPEDTTPELEGTVIPAWIPPLCNVYTKESVYVWYRFIEDAIDVEPDSCEQDSIGRMPLWMADNEDFDIDIILNTSFRDMRWATWAIEHGLAPGQPFLLRIDSPDYSSDYWSGEVDVKWNYAVLRAMPCKPERAARSWERVVRNINAFITARDEYRAKLDTLRRTDTTAYCLKTDSYWPSKYGYDDMTPPSGLRIYLCSKHSQLPQQGVKLTTCDAVNLVSGEDDDGKWEVAFERLVVNAEKAGFDPAVVRAVKESVPRF